MVSKTHMVLSGIPRIFRFFYRNMYTYTVRYIGTVDVIGSGKHRHKERWCTTQKHGRFPILSICCALTSGVDDEMPGPRMLVILHQRFCVSLLGQSVAAWLSTDIFVQVVWGQSVSVRLLANIFVRVIRTNVVWHLSKEKSTRKLQVKRCVLSVITLRYLRRYCIASHVVYYWHAFVVPLTAVQRS